MKKHISFLLAVFMLLSLCGCGASAPAETLPPQPVSQTVPATETGAGEVTVTDMIGRQVSIVPGSYKRVVCIGAGAL